MKITSFSPLILTTDPENTIKLFEELGFEKRHTKDSLDGREDIVGVRMKDANGFYVDIVKSGKTTQDMITIRMNVDDFDEAREMLESHGFKPSPTGIVPELSRILLQSLLVCILHRGFRSAWFSISRIELYRSALCGWAVFLRI